MKFDKNRLWNLAACALLCASASLSAENREALQNEMDRLSTASGGQAEISIDEATEVAGFIRFTPGAASIAAESSATAEEKTRAFLDDYQALLGLSDHRSELALVRAMTDTAGRGRTRYRQVYRGIPVFGAELTSHFNRNGELIAISSSTFPVEELDTTPHWQAPQARQIAIDHVAQQGLPTRPNSGPSSSRTGRSHAQTPDLTAINGELMIFRTGLVKGIRGRNHLAYRFEVLNASRSVREFVFVDAKTGKVLDQITGIHTALDRKVYEVALDDLVWEDSASNPSHPDPIIPGWDGGTEQQVTDWQNEIDGARETYNLIASMTLGDWRSYDGNDATMLTINNEAEMGCPNAQWDGVSTNYCSGVTGDDTVAHEWAHAYTEYTADLIYQWQPGALNESYSDVFGEVVDLLNGRGTDDPGTLRTAAACSVYGIGPNQVDDSYRWLSGEDDPGLGGAIRDMWQPNCYGDPGRVSDNLYWCTSGDNGGVHINSGIPNHGFALLVDGGSYNDLDVVGLGLTKAAHIYWESLQMLVPASDFADQADALEASCTNLIDINLPALSTDQVSAGPSGEVITTEDCDSVAAIIAAVELREDPVKCGFTTLLENNPPERCLDKGELQTISLTDWESGFGDWSAATHHVANPETFDTLDWALVGELPQGRLGSAAFVANLNIGNCDDDDESGVLNLDSPVIQLPAETAAIHVSVNHWMSSESDWDGGNLKISVNGGPFELVPSSALVVSPYNKTLFAADEANTNPLAGEPAYTGGDGGTLDGSWGQTQIALVGIADGGDQVQMRFDFGIDGCEGAVGWYVDEVEFYSCSEEFAPLCGNGVIDNTEQCDDGNLLDEDGCSAICEIEEGWQCEAAIPPADILDYSFEEGPFGGFWEEFSEVFGTPICDIGCLNDDGTGPSEGDYWAWFGGIELPDTYEEAFVSQSVTIPPMATELTFDMTLPACDSASDYLELRVDGNVVFRVDGEDPVCGDESYAKTIVDITSYADGNEHTLEFYSESFVANGKNTNFFVDNVAIPGTPSVCSFISGPAFTSVPEPGTALEFGNQVVSTESSALSVDVENTGNESLELACLISGNDANEFNLVACPSPVAVSATTRIDVACEPASIGSKTASLDITTNDTNAPEVSFPLTCTGVPTPQQIVIPSPLIQVIPATDPVSINASYNTSNGNESLDGLELRVHWDSTQLIFDDFSSVWADDLVSVDESCQADNSDFDNDSSTDCYATVVWSSGDSSFPGEGNAPTVLFTVNFTGDLSAAASTQVNFSAGALPTGYMLRVYSAVVEEETVGPQTLFEDGFDQ